MRRISTAIRAAHNNKDEQGPRPQSSTTNGKTGTQAVITISRSRKTEPRNKHHEQKVAERAVCLFLSEATPPLPPTWYKVSITYHTVLEYTAKQFFTFASYHRAVPNIYGARRVVCNVAQKKNAPPM